MDNYTKTRIALRYWLLGAGFHKAAEAMDFAEEYHSGTRKDGVTPEFSHQVAIASYLRTLHGQLLFPEETFCVAFLHDVREDYDVPDSVIRDKWGDRVANSVDALTKVFKGVKRTEEDVFQAISEDVIASIVKAADRIHNTSSMLGVFSNEKMVEYIGEARRILKVVKKARKRFPVQEAAYENAKHLLETQLTLLEAVLAERGYASTES